MTGRPQHHGGGRVAAIGLEEQWHCLNHQAL